MSAGLNLTALAARLNRLSDAVDRAAEAAVRTAAERARDHARAICPVGDGSDGGHLRDCIRAEAAREDGRAVGRVVAENPHAAYVEFGTGRRGGGSPHWPGMAARPYLRPALEAGRGAFGEEAARLLRDALGGGGI